MSFKKNFKIKNLRLSHNIIYAPLAEYTDFAFRRLIRHFHTGLMFCEMIKMEALIRDKSAMLLKYIDNMRPIGAQLYGSNPKIAKEGAKKIEDLGFDLIDLNCGCPSFNVIKDGSGSALLKNPKLIAEILYSMVKAVKIPVSVKIRLGWDENSICAKEIVKIAKEVGCSMITIHGRTKKQKYSGKASLEYIRKCKEVAGKDLLVIGNGDLYAPEDVKNMFDTTKCDGVMIARGMLASPWLSNEIENYFENREKQNICRKDILLRYIDYSYQEKGEKAIFDLRKISGFFLKDFKNIKSLRIGISKAKTICDAIKLIQDFNWR